MRVCSVFLFRIHASFILRKGLTRFQLLKGFLGLRIIECRNSSDNWNEAQCLTDRTLCTHCSRSFVSPDFFPQVPIASKHRLSLLVNLSSLHHHLFGSIHLKLLTCWVERLHPFAARVVDSCPSFLLHLSGGHNCLTRCPLQMFLKLQVCVEYMNQTH